MMRQRKIDIIDHISPKQAYALRRPSEFLMITHPVPTPNPSSRATMSKPFNRTSVCVKQCKLAIDLPASRNQHYDSIVDPVSHNFTRVYDRWGFPWKSAAGTKDEYTYNPPLAKSCCGGWLSGRIFRPMSSRTTTAIWNDGHCESYLRKIGIEMEIRPLPSPEWQNLFHKAKNTTSCPTTPAARWAHFRAVPRPTAVPENRRITGQWWTTPVSMLSCPAPWRQNRRRDEKSDAGRQRVRARQHFSISLLQPMAYSAVQPWVKGLAAVRSAWAHGGGPATDQLLRGEILD